MITLRRCSALPRLASLAAALVFGLALSVASAQPRQMQSIGVDTSKANIPIGEILSGGPPPNGIPALGFGGDHEQAARPTPEPNFVASDEAAAWLDAVEPVITVSVGGETKIYPLQILTWHEIANDTLGGVPVAATFCPLCNSALAFDRRVPLTETARGMLLDANPEAEIEPADDDLVALYDAQHGAGVDEEIHYQVVVDFGVSGMLFNANLLMFDTASSTLWSQILGQGNVGSLLGTELVRYPAQIVSFEAARQAFPAAPVLSRDTGIRRSYGRNPYTGYDDVNTPPFFPVSGDDDRLPPKERVASVELGGEAVAFPFSALRDARVVETEVGDVPLAAFWAPGTASALDTGSIAQGRNVGSVGVFDRRLDGRTLTFEWNGDAIVDTETGSRWNVLGVAESGPLEGSELEPVLHDNTLWFAWAAFKPETRLVSAER